MKPQTKDLVVRALKTFAQTFLATWAVYDFAFESNVLTATLAATISVLMNTIVPPKN